MIPTTFDSQDVFLLNHEWDGRAAFRAEVSLIRDLQRGLTTREARRPYSETLRCNVKFSLTLRDEELTAMTAALRDLNTQPVIVPFWPALTTWSTRADAAIKGGLMLAFNGDWTEWELYLRGDDPVVFTPQPSDFCLPVLWGFIKPLKPQMLAPDKARFQIEFTESSPADYCLQPAEYTFTDGPQPSGYAAAPKLLPFDPDFRKVIEQISVEVEREQLGFNREHHASFYQHEAFRSQSARYTLAGSDAGRMLRFFQDVAAPGGSFWATHWLMAARLTAGVGAGDVVLSVENTDAVAVGDYISLFSRSGIVRKITAKTADTITIDSAPGVALAQVNTSIFPASLSRLDRAMMTMEWRSAAAATCELALTEQPTEVIIPADETLGTTIGKLPIRVVLFEFTRDLRNGTVLNYYYTSHESQVSYGGHDWLPIKISHGDISQSTNLETDGCDISLFNFTGNPIMEDVLRRAEAPLTVTIRHADFDGTTVSNAAIVFCGDCDGPKRDGEKITMRGKAGPGQLDSMFPFFIRGRLCGHLRGNNRDGSYLISAGCTLLAANWKFTAKIGSPVSAAHPYLVYLTDLARAVGATPTFFADWFAGGRIEWGTGPAIQRRYISKSTVPSAGTLQVKLHKYFSGDPPLIGDDVFLYPGCDGQFSTCKAYHATTNPTGKFGNSDNFGGQPFSPIANPSIAGQVNLGVQGGKK